MFGFIKRLFKKREALEGCFGSEGLLRDKIVIEKKPPKKTKKKGKA